MIRITVPTFDVKDGPAFETKSGISRGGKPYTIHEQVAIVDLPNGERRRIKMQLDEERGVVNALAAGEYQPLPSAYYVGQFDALAISTRSRHWQAVAGSKIKAA